MTSSIRLFLVLLLSVGLFRFGYAQEAQTSAADMDAYIELISKLKTLPADRQIEELRMYLEKHPDSVFRAEIDQNIASLNKFLNQTNPERQKEEHDTELYLKAVALAKTLPQADQIRLWGQFLSENPNTIYKKDILYKLQDLRFKQPRSNLESEVPRENAGEAVQPVVRNLPYKEKDRAVLYAIFPGLIVPGMAHWYTKDYLIAGILTVLRITGLGIGLYGILQNESTPIVIGSVIAGFSYLGDITDAPFTVERYNDQLEKQNPVALSVSPFGLMVSRRF